MTWNELLAEKRVETHMTTKQELDDLRSVVERNLRDATTRNSPPTTDSQWLTRRPSCLER